MLHLQRCEVVAIYWNRDFSLFTSHTWICTFNSLIKMGPLLFSTAADAAVNRDDKVLVEI